MSNLFNKLGKILVVAVLAAALGWLIYSLFGSGTDTQYKNGIYVTRGYISRFAGYEFTMPERCQLFDLEERAVQSDIDVTGLTKEQIVEALRNQTTILDLFAYLPSGSNALVSISINKETSKDDVDLATKDYIRLLQNSGVNISGDYELVNFLGRDCGLWTYEANNNGKKVIQEGYVFAEDGFEWALIISYAEGNEAEKEQLYNSFKIYE